MKQSKTKRIKATDFDKLFEEGEVIKHLDRKSMKAHFPMLRISIDFPKKIIEGVDLEAAKIGITRTSLIKIWVAEHLNRQTQ